MRPLDLYRFTDDAREQEFRESALAGDRRQAILVSAVVVPIGFFFIVSDYRLYGLTSSFWYVASLRFLFVAAGATAMWALVRSRRPGSYDRVVTLWMAGVVLLLLVIDASRPATYTGHAVMEVLTVLLVYTAVRLSPLRQATIALGLSVGVVGLFVVVKDLTDPLTMTVVGVSLLLANGLGFALSVQIERYRRTQHRLLATERGLRESLERAMAELRTLRGVVPICSSCKKIRDTEGVWHPVEVFVQQRSEAEFSHGVCPDCEEVLFPEPA